jgi:hypothetical protein
MLERGKIIADGRFSAKATRRYGQSERSFAHALIIMNNM